MRKTAIFLILIFIVVLSACQSNGSTKASADQPGNKVVKKKSNHKKSNDSKPEKTKKKSSSKKVNNDKKKTNGPLTSVGETHHDSQRNLDVKLLGIKKVNQSIKLNSVKFTIQDIKILQFSNIHNQEILSQMQKDAKKPNGKTFNEIQIGFIEENTSENNVRINEPIKALVLNTGEQIDVGNVDMGAQNLYGETLYGKVEKTSFIVVPVATDPSKIKSIKIVTGRIDDENMNTVANPKTVQYSIK